MSLKWVVFCYLIANFIQGYEAWFNRDDEDIEFGSSVFKYPLDDGNNSLASNDFNLRLKMQWIDEKAKGEDVPFHINGESEVYTYYILIVKLCCTCIFEMLFSGNWVPVYQ